MKKQSSRIPISCQQVDVQLPSYTNKNLSVLDFAVDTVIIIQDIKKFNHFQDKNKLVHNESCQQLYMKI